MFEKSPAHIKSITRSNTRTLSRRCRCRDDEFLTEQVPESDVAVVYRRWLRRLWKHFSGLGSILCCCCCMFQRFPETTPVQICPRSRTDGRPRPTSLWSEGHGSRISATRATTWWGGRPWPVSWTCPGAHSRPSVKRVSFTSTSLSLCLQPQHEVRKFSCFLDQLLNIKD